MLDVIGLSFGGLMAASTVFMVGYNIANKSKKYDLVDKDVCNKHREDINTKFGNIHEKINAVALDTAKSKAMLEILYEKYGSKK